MRNQVSFLHNVSEDTFGGWTLEAMRPRMKIFLDKMNMGRIYGRVVLAGTNLCTVVVGELRYFVSRDTGSLLCKIFRGKMRRCVQESRCSLQAMYEAVHVREGVRYPYAEVGTSHLQWTLLLKVYLDI